VTAACVSLFQPAVAQLQTGETLAVVTTDAGPVRGYVHNKIIT
jgi:TusA-related sulfurtransferase